MPRKKATPAEETPVIEQEEVTPAVAHEGESQLKESASDTRSDREKFYQLDFREIDRNLTPEEQQEWNSIYASYRSRSAITGTIIGVDPISISVQDEETGENERRTVNCCVIVLHRVKILIPESELWHEGEEQPTYVMRNTIGASIDFIVTHVDRENNLAMASRKQALAARRAYFAKHPSLRRQGQFLTCRLLVVGPRRCLVECYGHDIGLTQRDIRYAAIPDLREMYYPGQELPCIVKGYDTKTRTLEISIKETQSNPFDGAIERHPLNATRYATICGKYGGGVFCNLPDGTVVMCLYSYRYEDSDFSVGDKVILSIFRYDMEKKQIYGRILSKLHAEK